MSRKIKLTDKVHVALHSTSITWPTCTRVGNEVSAQYFLVPTENLKKKVTPLFSAEHPLSTNVRVTQIKVPNCYSFIELNFIEINNVKCNKHKMLTLNFGLALYKAILSITAIDLSSECCIPWRCFFSMSAMVYSDFVSCSAILCSWSHALM